MRKPYPSDLTDEQWEIIKPLIPVNTVGRPARSRCGRCSTPSSTSTAPAAVGHAPPRPAAPEHRA